MLFSSNIFIFWFLPFVLAVYYGLLRKHRTAKNIFLSIASLFFYAWGEPAFVFVMIGVICFNYVFALLIDKYKARGKAKPLLILSVVGNLSILFVYKYLMFFMGIFNTVTGSELSIPQIALPIGISFFTFQAMSYCFDVYRGNGQVQKNIMNVVLYVSFFPQLIAGPIVRYQTVADQINNRIETAAKFSAGMDRFIVGLGKKVLLSNTVALLADRAFDMNDSSVIMAWAGAIAYTLQIYFDFSGYSDMAIGLGRMFGFEFLENFDYPYISKSISEFWRRWHISMGTWFRDYVYFPLGGSRVKTKSRLVFNLLVVWFLTGLWHGADWTFIIWGLSYFVLLAIEKLTGFEKNNKIPVAVKHIYTMFFVVMGWVLFRADNMSDALTYFCNMFGLSGNPIIGDTSLYYIKQYAFTVILAAVFSLPLLPWVKSKLESKKIYPVLKYTCMMAVFLLSLAYIQSRTYNPFIYFNF